MSKFNLHHRFHGVSIRGPFIYQKAAFNDCQTGRNYSPHFWNGLVTYNKILMTWISDFITFLLKFNLDLWSSVWGRLFIKRPLLVNIRLVVLQSKILKFSISDFVTFVQIWFGPSSSRRSYFRVVYLSKRRV